MIPDQIKVIPFLSLSNLPDRKSQRPSEKYANYKYPPWVQLVEKKVKTILGTSFHFPLLTPYQTVSLPSPK
jgi:hypothetical protein